MPSSLASNGRAQQPLADEAIGLRIVDLTRDGAAVSRAERTLAPAEVARARRGTPAVHRRRVLLRAALREALGAELRAAPVDVPISATGTGCPYVPGRPDLGLSCSASGALGLVAVGRGRRVGVDIELVAPWSADLDGDWLSESERHALRGLPTDARGAAATRCWTQKEAVLKGRGSGLLQPLSSVVTVVGRPDGTVAGWQLRDVAVPHGWVASIATAPLGEDLA